jgi:hypothetical protein
VRARAQARRTRRVPRRTLRPLQADLRTVWQQWRDRRLTRAEARRVVRAPSELELRELAALAVRRRAGLAVVVVALVAVTAAAFGPLVLGVVSGETLVGGALVPATAGLRDLWDAATSGWVSGELGAPGPADAFLSALLPGTALAGGSLGVALAALVLGGMVLSGLGAWFAAGAATRSVSVRVWAALVWAALPSLLLAAGQGRAGAVLVHAALPWLVLALARAVGAQQVDEVLSGVATAVRTEDAGAVRDPGAEEWPDPEAWARAGEAPRGRRRRRAGDDAAAGRDVDATGERPNDAPDEDGGPVTSGEPEDAATPADELDTVTPVRGTRALEPAPGRPSATARVEDGVTADPRTQEAQEDAPDASPDASPEDVALAPPARPTGSIAAAAAASLAFAAVAAGAPALLLPGVVLLLVVAACAPRGRRLRVVLAAVPALVLLGPTLAEAASRGVQGVRLLLADPGSPLTSTPASPVATLLGVPVDAPGLVPSWLPSWVPDLVAAWWPAAAGAAVLLLALLALLHGAPQARAVRIGWCTAAVGLAAALVAGRVAVGQDDGTVVPGWAGSGVSLAMAGLLAAAVTGTRGLRAWLDRASFGWRQVTTAVVTLVVVLLPLAALTGWAGEARGGATDLTTMSRAVVPAIGRQTQESQDAPRVLALVPSADQVVDWQLLRGNGPQVVDDAAAVRTRELDGSPGDPDVAEPDDATAELQDVVGTLSVGSSTDVAADLAALAVADVLVPPLTEAQAGDVTLDQARTALVGRLDATPGLERITEGVAGVIWRVQPSGAAVGEDAAADDPDDEPGTEAGAADARVVTAWARLVPDATDAQDAAGLTGEGAVAVAAVPGVVGRVGTEIEPGDGGRLLVLAERADAGWRATLDGVPLRAVTDGWRQTFEVGADGGRLVVEHSAPDRTVWTVAQAVVLLLAVLLALPVRRRRAGRR